MMLVCVWLHLELFANDQVIGPPTNKLCWCTHHQNKEWRRSSTYQLLLLLLLLLLRCLNGCTLIRAVWYYLMRR